MRGLLWPPRWKGREGVACSCKGAKNRKTYQVQLPGGLKVTKASEAEALAFAAKHKGAKVIAPAAS